MEIILKLFGILLGSICETVPHPEHGSFIKFIKYMESRGIPMESVETISKKQMTCFYILKYKERVSGRTLYSCFYYMDLDKTNSLPIMVLSEYYDSLEDLIKHNLINGAPLFCRSLLLNNFYYLDSEFWDDWVLDTKNLIPLNFNKEEKKMLELYTLRRIHKCPEFNPKLICFPIPMED